MKKGKVARLAGFVGALGVSTVLVTTAVQGTGAYFEDSASGTISASSGHLTLSTSDPTLNYANLMPGSNQDENISYQVAASDGGVDLWMVFNPDGSGYQRFTGGAGSPKWPDGGLGRYGYFKVSDSNGGLAFRSGNLSFADDTNTNNGGPNNCTVNDNGRGGSDWIATKVHPNATQFCGVPSAILLASDLGNGASGTVTVTFGLNGYLQTQQNQNEGTVGYKLVATQHGIRPGASD